MSKSVILKSEKNGSKTNTHQNEKFMQNISDYQMKSLFFFKRLPLNIDEDSCDFDGGV